MKEPNIQSLKSHQHGFHDSFLKELTFSQDLSILEVLVECNFYRHKLWKLIFSGVLRFEFETLGTGVTLIDPVDIYDIYIKNESIEAHRWENRLRELDIDNTVYHVILASMYHRGLLIDKMGLEGIQIICRDIRIEKG